MVGDLKKVGGLPFHVEFKIKTYTQRLELCCWRQIDPYVFVRFFFLGLISQNDRKVPGANILCDVCGMQERVNALVSEPTTSTLV